VDDAPENQRADLALLLSFMDEPELAGRLVGRERSWLRRRRELDEFGAPCWAPLEPGARQRGLAALRGLAKIRCGQASSLEALEHGRDALPAADAQRREAVPAVALAQ